MHSHAAGCGCEQEAQDGEKFSLYRFINVGGVRALNARDKKDAARRVFKPEHEKLNGQYVESDHDDDDEEQGRLAFVVPFVGSVKLRKIIVGASGESCPTEVRLYKNCDTFDLDDASSQVATQTIRLGDDVQCELDLPVVAPKFNDCRSLVFFFPSSKGGQVTRVTYIGLLGEHVKPQRALVGVVYEATPQLSDHKSKADQTSQHNIGH